MPKRNGINKTFSFQQDVVEKLEWLCDDMMRTQTNVIEFLIREKWRELNAGKTEVNRSNG